MSIIQSPPQKQRAVHCRASFWQLQRPVQSFLQLQRISYLQACVASVELSSILPSPPLDVLDKYILCGVIGSFLALFLPLPSPYCGVCKTKTLILRNDCVHEIVPFPRASHMYTCSYIYYIYIYIYITENHLLVNEKRRCRDG